MSSVQFVFSLLDKMSGPAAKIAKQVGEVDASLKKVDKASAPLPGVFGKVQAAMKDAYGDKASGMFGRFVNGTVNAGDAAKAVGVSFDVLKKGAGVAKDGAAALGSGLMSVASMSAMAAAAVGLAAGGLVAAGGNMLVEATKFNDEMGLAYEHALGSAEKGNTSLGYAKSIANTLGKSADEVAGQMRSLFRMGLNGRESEQIVQMADTLKAITGEDYSKQLGQSIASLKKREPLTPQMLEPLMSIGPAAKAKVLDGLAKKLGVTTKDAVKREQEIMARLPQLKNDKAMKALADAYKDATGEKKAGEVAKQFRDTTLTGSIEKVQAKVKDLFKNLQTSKVGTTLIAALQKIAGALDPATPSGKKLIATLEKAAEVAGRIFGKIDFDKVVAGFDSVVTAVDGMLGPIEELGSGFFDGLGEAVSTVIEFAGAMGLADSSASGMSVSFKSIGKAAGYVVAGIGTVIASAIAIEVKLASVAASVLQSGANIGLNIIEGIAKGLASAKGMLEDALRSVADSLPEVVRKALKIQSPSKVFEAIGSFSIQGFTQGVEKEQDNAMGATVAALSPPTSAPSRGGGSTQSISAPISITVNGGESAEKTAALVEQSVTRAMLAVFEGVALESGAVSA